MTLVRNHHRAMIGISAAMLLGASLVAGSAARRTEPRLPRSAEERLDVVLNGFSRRFTEGPGAGIGHVFSSTDGGTTWNDITNDFPDVPSNSIKVLPNGALIVGTDLGVVYRPAASTTWRRLGTNFPATVVLDVEIGPDGFLYAATHGRGIWRITTSGL
jgi:hypothetical protein